MSKIALFFVLLPKLINAQISAFGEEFYFYKNPAATANNFCTQVNTNYTYFRFTPVINLQTNILSFETPFFKQNSLGLLLKKTYNKTKTFTNDNFYFSYAYTLKLSKIKFVTFSLSIDYALAEININNLIFPSMINDYGEIFYLTEPLDPVKYKDFGISTGFVYRTKRSFFGAGLKNFYKQNNSKLLQTNLNLFYRQVFYNDYQKNNPLIFRTYSELKQASFFNSTGVEKQINNIFFSVFFLQNLTDKNYSYGLNTNIKFFNGKIGIKYSFSTFLGGLYKKYGTIHEIGVQMRFYCKKNKKHTIICPAYEL